MRLHLDIRPGADGDLVEIADYIAQDSLDAAIRFLTAARRAMEFLTTTPMAGPEYAVANPRLTGLRKWSIKGFPNYLIFYRIHADSIEVLRVIHGARDIPTILEGEPE